MLLAMAAAVPARCPAQTQPSCNLVQRIRLEIREAIGVKHLIWWQDHSLAILHLGDQHIASAGNRAAVEGAGIKISSRLLNLARLVPSSTGEGRSRSMSFLHNMPIKRKVSVVILLSTLTTLLLASAAVFGFEVIHIRRTITRDLATQGRIVAANSTAALLFNDQKAASEILASLRVNPHILCSCIYLPTGELFAHDGPEADRDELPSGTFPEGFRFNGPNILLFQPVLLNGKHIGLLYLRFDFKAMQMEVIKPCLVILGSIFLASTLLALLLSSRLQHIISIPILKLADTARKVAEQKDYSVRATGSSRDEIGMLTAAFNRMLDRIQEHDHALRAVNQNLEVEVAERQRKEQELSESRQRFEVAVMGSSVGLWIGNCRPTNFTFLHAGKT